MYEKRYNPFAANVELVKGYLKSGKVLILGILHFLSLALTVVTMVLVPYDRSVSELMSAINSLGVNTSDFTSSIQSLLSNGTFPIVISAVLSAIFTILTAIAFIVMFAKSRNTNPDSNPSSGASILRTLSMITFVCSIILAVIIVAGYVLFIIGVSSVNESFGGDAQQATITQVVIGIVVSLFLILFISYVSCQKNFYRSIKWSLNSVKLYHSGAAGYGVFNIIFAVFIGISLTVSAITVIKSFNISNLLVLISNLLSCLTAIMTAAFALGYNRYIKQAKYGYSDPYGGNAGAPYYPDDRGAQSYGAQPYQNYHVPPQQNMPPYNETPDNISAPEQETTAYCTNCGAEVKGNRPFCTNCGNKL